MMRLLVRGIPAGGTRRGRLAWPFGIAHKPRLRKYESSDRFDHRGRSFRLDPGTAPLAGLDTIKLSRQEQPELPELFFRMVIGFAPARLGQ